MTQEAAGNTAVGTGTTPLRSIRPLTGLRAVAAVWVVFEHFYSRLSVLIPWTRHLKSFILTGYLGVEVFFVLSGFILSYNYLGWFARFSGARYRRFLRLRLARLYPMQLFTLGVLAAGVAGARLVHHPIAHGLVFTRRSFVANLFLVQELWPSRWAGWNLPAWSISAEWCAYLCLPLLAPALLRLRTVRSAALAAGALTILTIGLVVSIEPGTLTEQTGLLRVGGEFLVGCCLLRIYQIGGYRLPRWSAPTLLAATLVVPGLLDMAGLPPLLALPVFGVLILALARDASWLGRLLSCRAFLFAGEASYSLYMTHYVVITLLGSFLDPARIAGSGALVRTGLTVVWLGCFAVAGIGTYVFIERPGRRLLRGHAARIGPATPVADPESVAVRRPERV